LGSAGIVPGTAASGDQSNSSLFTMADGTVIVAFSDQEGWRSRGMTEVIHAIKLTIDSTSGELVPSAGFLRLDQTMWLADGDPTAKVLDHFATMVAGATLRPFDCGDSIVPTGFMALIAADLRLI